VKLVPVSREDHGLKKIRTPPTYAAFRPQAVISLFGAEVARAAHDFPIGFTAEKEGYFPAALTGVEPGKNLFVGLDGAWLAGYHPALLRRAPFLLARLEDSENWVLCLDEDSDLLSDKEGQPLFAEDGSPTPLVAQATEFLVELERNRVATLAACAVLDKLRLLCPWELTVEKGGATFMIQGLYRVDQERLRLVPPDGLVELRDTGALLIAYAHQISQVNLSLLGRLTAAHDQAEAQRQALLTGSVDLDRAFGIIDDDPFQF
jgi:hypothetical protein